MRNPHGGRTWVRSRCSVPEGLRAPSLQASPYKGAREIRVVNRTLARAVELRSLFGPPVTAVPWDEREAALEGIALLANATDQGMAGKPPLDIRLERLPRSAIVGDLIYTPLETPLLAAARARET